MSSQIGEPWNYRTLSAGTVAPWHELTPRAQDAARDELNDLLMRTTMTDANALRQACATEPALVPHAVNLLRSRAGKT